ncbi:2-alkyl-3-oxoalkanoate reductase [Arenimonas sp. MALMAid1274]|uniref:2-alkyl-3-oxoalkanoate reductase n=1 Tax=Arenimonas sp. MALMAid1274 TaxID=3411630 RepID=UPI003BA309CC
MKVLVTGGAGFLGQALCAGLVAQGHEVTSFQRSHSTALDAMGVRQVRGDLADAAAVTAAFAGQQAIFHNAAKAGAWGSYDSYFQANVVGTRNVLAAMRQHGIPTLVYTSTPSVTHSGRTPVEGGNEADTPYGHGFKAPYPATKLVAEREVLAANDATLATVALRPRLIWGPGDTQLLPRLAERARAGRLRFIDGGHNRMDTTYIDNAAQAHLDAFAALRPGAACAGRAYFISNGEPRPVRQIVNDMLAAAGVPPVTGEVPYAVAYAAGALLEPVWKLLRLGGEPPMTRFLAEQLSTPHWYDISAAARDFGYLPRVSTAEGLQRLARWWHDPARPA